MTWPVSILLIVSAAVGWALCLVIHSVIGHRMLRLKHWWREGQDYVLETNRGTYRGQCTVWRNYENGQRPGVLMESALSDLENLIKWGRVDALQLKRSAEGAAE